jgi:hypothetical protein
MARTPLSMWLMKKRLERAGYACSLFGYSVALKDLDEIVDRFLSRVHETVGAASRPENPSPLPSPATGEGATSHPENPSPLPSPATGEGATSHPQDTASRPGKASLRYAVVGHSLGNVIARLATPRLPPGWCRFAMLAPPNRASVMAQALGDNAIYRATTRDTGQKLTDEAFFAGLPMPEVPSLIIAGTRGPRAAWLPFRGEPNDAVLKVAETELEGVPRIEVDGIHSFLMNRRDVFEAIRDFFASGTPPAC